MSKTMKFSELYSYVQAWEDDERRMEVRFGCDCGCGGDYYTLDQWKDMCSRADEAKDKLRQFGVVFNE